MRTKAPAIFRMEVIRRWRSIQDDSRQLAATAIAVVFGLIPVALGGGGAFFLGQSLAGGGEFDMFGPFLPIARTAAASVVGFVALVVAFRAVQQSGTPKHPDGILTIARHRDVVAALAGIELLVFGGMIGVPGVLAAVAFGVGAGSPLAAVLVTVALLSAVALGGTLGYALGLAIKIAFARVEILARFKTLIGVLVFAVYFAVIYSQRAQSAFAPLVDALAATPLGWFADLALLAVYADAVPLYAGASVALLLVGVPAAFLAASWLAGALWYSTPVQPEAETVESGMGSSGLLDRPTERIVRKTWIRARRSPLRLVFVAYPLLIFLGPLSDALASGNIPGSLPPTMALYGAWATGAAFTLNPLGDEGPVLPVTLTSPVDGPTFVRALCLAGLAVGLPVTVLGTAVTAVLAGLTPLEVVGVTLLAVVLTTAAPAMATGVGAAFPRLEPVQAAGNREMIIPSMFAFAIYSLVLIVAAIPGLVGAFIGVFTDELFGLPPVTLLGIGLGVTVVVAGAAGGLSYRSAVGAFDGYTYD